MNRKQYNIDKILQHLEDVRNCTIDQEKIKLYNDLIKLVKDYQKGIQNEKLWWY